METPDQKIVRLFEHKLGLNLQHEDGFMAIPESTWIREGFDRYDVHHAIMKWKLFGVILQHKFFHYTDDYRKALPANLGYTLEGPATLDTYKADYLLRVRPDERTPKTLSNRSKTYSRPVTACVRHI